MLFLFVLSLLYLTKFATSQTISASEEINKIIGEILLKAEKKNSEPIKFSWYDRITADGLLVTQHYNEVRSNEKKTKIFDPIPEAFSRSEPKKYSTSLRLQDIIYEFNKMHPQTARAPDTNLTTDDGHTTKTHKVNHSSKTRTRYKNKMTPPMDKLPTVTKEPIIMATVATLAPVTKYDAKPIAKSWPNEATYFKSFPIGSHDRQFSESIFKTKLTSHLEPTTHATSKIHEAKTPPLETSSQLTSTTDNESSWNDLYQKTFQNKFHKDVKTKRPCYTMASLYTLANHTKQNSMFKYITATQWEGLKDIEDLVNSVPNYPIQSEKPTESLSELIKKFSAKDKSLYIVPHTTKARYRIGVKKEKGRYSMVAPKPLVIPKSLVTKPRILSLNDTEKTHVPKYSISAITSNTPSSDVYLLVDNKQKTLKAIFTITLDKDKEDGIDTTRENTAKATGVKDTDITLYTNAMDTQTEESDFKKDVEDLYKDILNRYGTVKSAVEENDNDKPKEKFHEKIIRNVNWDRIKKFFGHDRVCNCHCKANKTMCRVCSASDSVIRELTFEFNNLADFMNEHCTEIQTFFWLNPTGGKKLRDSVHRIDRTMHDYYKRVKGKCTGRTCKTFATYLDKRHYDKKKEDKKYLEELLQDLGISEF